MGIGEERGVLMTSTSHLGWCLPIEGFPQKILSLRILTLTFGDLEVIGCCIVYKMRHVALAPSLHYSPYPLLNGFSEHLGHSFVSPLFESGPVQSRGT